MGFKMFAMLWRVCMVLFVVVFLVVLRYYIGS